MSKRYQLIPTPVTPIEMLAAKFSTKLHMPDPGPLYVLMGAVAANMIEGPPVWLMLVGPPSCGKTEILNSLLSIEQMVEGGDISGEAAFLSGTSTKDVGAGATGGLLRQVGAAGGLVLNDFTSVLSKPRDRIAGIMACFRETYGGRWTRHLGTDGGRCLQWRGRLALFGGVTGAIDGYHQASVELGERWVYYRYPFRDTFQEVNMSLSNDRGEWRNELRQAVHDFFQGLGLNFTVQLPRREFSIPEKLRIYKMARVAASCRSGISRDPYTKEIVASKEVELATRLSTVLAQLLVGMDIIGVPEKIRWKLLARVAMNSMPLVRSRIIEALLRNNLTVKELQPITEVSMTVLKRIVEDLTIHGVLETKDDKIALTAWMLKDYKPEALRAL